MIFFLHVHLISYRLAGFICSRSVLFCYRIFEIFYKENCVICKQEPFDVFLPRLYAFCSLFFFGLTAQARTSSMMLNKNQDSRCPCLVPNPRGKAVGYLWCSLSCSGSPFHSYVYESFFFNHEWVLSFLKCLLGTDWYDQMIFHHYPGNMANYRDWCFWILNHPWIPGIDSTWP